MKRKFLSTLVDWKEKHIETPLMVIGARQTGKTYILDYFCKNYFEHYVYINLELEEDIARIFEETLAPDEIVKIIELKKNMVIDPSNTVIFFDEIQVSERAITSLKYFAESDKNYKVVTAGSLLGVKVNRFKSSFPVGKVYIEYLYPMDFEEFLWAKGQDMLTKEIKDCFDKRKEISKPLHEMALKSYKEYLCIGGMPKAVQEYIKNECDVAKFDRTIHESMLASYLADMRKYTYTATESIKIQQVFESMPLQLAKDNKKFKYTLVEKGATRKNFELPLDWLVSSNIIVKCDRIKLPETPLKAYIDIEYFKMYMSDVGLLNSIAKIKYSDIILESNFMFKGAIAENYIAQTFIANKRKLYYWRSKGDAEIDFLIDTEKDKIIPVEVKAKNNVTSKSLNEYMNKFNPKYGIRISTKNFGFNNDIFSVPLYAAYLI